MNATQTYTADQIRKMRGMLMSRIADLDREIIEGLSYEDLQAVLREKAETKKALATVDAITPTDMTTAEIRNHLTRLRLELSHTPAANRKDRDELEAAIRECNDRLHTRARRQYADAGL